MVYDDTYSITVNGEHRRVIKGISVADLALELGLEPTRVAVERNLEIVPRSRRAGPRSSPSRCAGSTSPTRASRC